MRKRVFVKWITKMIYVMFVTTCISVFGRISVLAAPEGEVDIEEEDVIGTDDPLPPVDVKWEAPGVYSFKIVSDQKVYYYVELTCHNHTGSTNIVLNPSDNYQAGDTYTGNCANFFDIAGTYTIKAFVRKGYGEEAVYSSEEDTITWSVPKERVEAPANVHWEISDKDQKAVIVCDPVDHACGYWFYLYEDGKIQSILNTKENRADFSFYIKATEKHEYRVRAYAFSDDLTKYANSEASEMSAAYVTGNTKKDDDNKIPKDSYPRLITGDDGKQRVYRKGVELARYTGLAILGAEGLTPWVYAENSKLNTKFSGYVDYEGSKFYVEKGYVKTDLNGVMIDPNSEPDWVWYFNANGQVQMKHVGLAEYDGEWFYIENGKVATEMNAFVEYDGGLFAVGAGRIIREYNGLMQDPQDPEHGAWYYFANGQAQTEYTGLVQYDDGWFYVINGKLAEDYTGTVEYDGSEFNVVNGMVK